MSVSPVLASSIDDGKGAKLARGSDGVGREVLHLRSVREVSYEVVHPARGVFDIDEDTLASVLGARDALLVVDRTVDALFGTAIRRYAEAKLHALGVVLVDGTEGAKCWGQVEQICTAAVRRGLSRDGAIVGIGGGSTLDVAGLAASIFRRGVQYLRVPTTLVGMVDVCVGIKHAVNFMGEKSTLGSFYPPSCGINDLSLLRTLPQRHIACGLAEIIKLAAVCDERLFAALEIHAGTLVASRFQRPARIARRVAIEAERLMMAELEPNLFEQHRNRLVDFGHSFSPRFEAATHFSMPHGEAVAIDMVLSTALGVERGLCGDQVLDRLVQLCRQAELPIAQAVLPPVELARTLLDVRRHRGGALNLVVPTAIGSATFVQDVTARDLANAVRRVGACASAGPTPHHAGDRL